MNNKRFKSVAVGGTFDELHKGHKTLLLKAFEVGEQVLIGLCTDEFVAKMKKPHMVASYEERLIELKCFLNKHGLLERAKIIPLNDAYGATLQKGCLEAIVVSKETEPTAKKINEERTKHGLEPLKVVTIEMVPSENHAPISTTRIRMGEIDREGRLIKKHA
ncbi:phosphopantetheine adenylyltransferase [Candidatus Bathyarchaeota archaeon]|nr:phosphopantetheine adenylyltransferase [Candidatus Bathyarchaeota archaeon]